MIEIKVTGEVVKRVFNAQQESKNGLMFATDYIVLKCDDRDTKKGVVNDYLPIEVFSSNISEPWVRDVREGYRIECELFVECIPWGELEINSYKQKSGYVKKSPRLFPTFKIKTMTILTMNNKEDRDIANRSFEEGVSAPESDPESDLPF